MALTKEQLARELASLHAQEQEHLQNLLAVRGAVQLCEQLIARAEEIPSSPTDSKVPPAVNLPS